jgi:hypothetical protein
MYHSDISVGLWCQIDLGCFVDDCYVRYVHHPRLLI